MRYYRIYYHIPELKRKDISSFNLLVEAKNEKHAYMKFLNKIREADCDHQITRVIDKIVER